MPCRAFPKACWTEGAMPLGETSDWIRVRIEESCGEVTFQSSVALWLCVRAASADALCCGDSNEILHLRRGYEPINNTSRRADQLLDSTPFLAVLTLPCREG